MVIADIIKVKLGRGTFTAFKEALPDSSTTGEALTRIEVLRRRYNLDSSQQRSIDSSEKKWRERDKDGLIRFGTKWTSEEDAIKSNLDANRQIDLAMEKLGERDYRTAATIFERAGRNDSGGVRAPFALGFLHLTKTMYDPVRAQKQFEIVLKRVPNHPPALNNAALASIRVGKYSEAFRYWRIALEEQPDSPEIRHNVARMQVLSGARTQKLVMSSNHSKRFVDLRENYPSADGAAATTVGFLYSPLVLSKIEKSAEFERSPHKVNSEGLIIDTMGSGFVCAPEYVMTNRHIVGSAVFGQCEAMKVSDPTSGSKLESTVVAVSPTMDIALVHCPGLKASPLQLKTDLPEIGKDLSLFGFPRTAEPGSNSEALPLTVTAIPDAANRGTRLGSLLMFEGEANAGHSGGPILSEDNQVLGLFTMGTIGIGVYRGGIPANDLRGFLAANIDGYQPIQNTETRRDPQSSTVQVLTYRKPIQMELEKVVEDAPRLNANSPSSLRRRYLEDRSCVVCKGRSKNDCPANNCISGVVSEKKFRTVVLGKGNTARIVKQVYFDKKACKTCRGTGLVDCKHCKTGADPAIR